MSLLQTITWDVESRSVYDEQGSVIPGYQRLCRNDNGLTLNIPKKSYQHTPNALLIQTVEQIAEVSGLKIEGYDEFKKGRTILAFLAVPEPMTVAGHQFQEHMVVGNSHDGSSSFFVGTSNTLIRCTNAFGRITQSLKVRHTRNHTDLIASIPDLFNEFSSYREDLKVTFDDMAEVDITPQIHAALIERITSLETEEILGTRADLNKRKLNILNDIEGCIQRECADLGKNLFGLFNGVTYYTTHIKKQAERAYGAMQGGVYNLNNTAFDYCLEVLDDLDAQVESLTAGPVGSLN